MPIADQLDMSWITQLHWAPDPKFIADFVNQAKEFVSAIATNRPEIGGAAVAVPFRSAAPAVHGPAVASFEACRYVLSEIIAEAAQDRPLNAIEIRTLAELHKRIEQSLVHAVYGIGAYSAQTEAPRSRYVFPCEIAGTVSPHFHAVIDPAQILT